ncbi:MAG TPA: cytochrome c oxidase subunit 3 family protein [Rhodospirillaceae bacterium]|nr:cytochrome c oxidase subunit 3 family protein [Rhodospirillaceae bacterium]
MTAAQLNDGEDWGALSELPGNPMIWVLILSELVVFGIFFVAFAFTRAFHVAVFESGQAHLDRLHGGINTAVLLTSGLAAALGQRAIGKGLVGRCRGWLFIAGLGGLLFLSIKLIEYADLFTQGFGLETNSFFTLFFLMTGFHALHLLLGLVLLGIVARYCTAANVETAAAFWHMVDLIWVLLYPLVYLIQ